MTKNFVLDTNVLIHNPLSIYSFADNNVIIPLTVIEELDRFKSSVDKKGMHARQVLREIDRLTKRGALKKGAHMFTGGTLIIAMWSKELNLPDLDADYNDNRILGVAHKLMMENKQVIFVSKDVNARIKAEALGITTRDYENQKVEYESLYKGWREIKVPKEEVDQLKRGESLPVKGQMFLENECVVVQSEEDPDYDDISRFDGQTSSLIPIRQECSVLGISPLNVEQRFAFDILMNDEIKLVTLVGQAGTGKTLMALACGLSKVIGFEPLYEKLLVVRPIVPLGKDIGYLPGSKGKKLSYWMQPIYDNLEFIMKKAITSKSGISVSDLTIENLLKSETLEVEAVTYIRGRSIPNQFLIVDEAQNLTPHEIKTIVSRAGHGTKIILTGDPDQIDNPYLDANSNGLSYVVERLKQYKIFGHIFLSHSERSELASIAVEVL